MRTYGTDVVSDLRTYLTDVVSDLRTYGTDVVSDPGLTRPNTQPYYVYELGLLGLRIRLASTDLLD